MVLTTVATFALGKPKTGTTLASLKVARGSVLEFTAPKKKSQSQLSQSQSQYNKPANVGAIVNAANEGCLGGGGVDGAINDAGGCNLWKDREALPLLLSKEKETSSGGGIAIRCNTGKAVVTGPGDYGSLRVNYVVHAVGPAYFHYSRDDDNDSAKNDNNNNNNNSDNGEEYDEFAIPDALLRSAYQESLERCRDEGITDVGFSLLSAGIFRGKRSLQEVLTIGVMAIRDWVVAEGEQLKDSTATATEDGDGEEDGEIFDNDENDEVLSSSPQQLKSITLCGFSKIEVNTLTKVCRIVFSTNNDDDDRTEGEEKDDIVVSNNNNTKRPRSKSDEP